MAGALSPPFFEGKASYTIKQVYETTADDAYYGLGQHQDDVYDYKGQQVFLFQNNTEVAVPFLVSAKTMGCCGINMPYHGLAIQGLTSRYHR